MTAQGALAAQSTCAAHRVFEYMSFCGCAATYSYFDIHQDMLSDLIKTSCALVVPE